MSYEAKYSQKEDKISHSRPNSGLRLPLLTDLIMSLGLPEEVGCYGNGRRWDRIWKKTIKSCKSRKDSYDFKVLGLNTGRWLPLPTSFNIAVIITQAKFPNFFPNFFKTKQNLILLCILGSQKIKATETRIIVLTPPSLQANSTTQDFAVCSCIWETVI